MIEILDVSKTYGTGNRALRDVNITIEDGEFDNQGRRTYLWRDHC